MKYLLLSIVMITLRLNVLATEWCTYYVYYEAEYLQGTWTRAGLVEGSDYKYLAVQVFEDLFGSDDEQMARKFLSRLQEKNPELYNWQYELAVAGDTVIISSDITPGHEETIKNEITATFTFNNFQAVTFNFAGRSETRTNQDLTIPYFDLVSNKSDSTSRAAVVRQEIARPPTETAEHKQRPVMGWLIASGVLNLALLAVLLIRRRNR